VFTKYSGVIHQEIHHVRRPVIYHVGGFLLISGANLVDKILVKTKILEYGRKQNTCVRPHFWQHPKILRESKMGSEGSESERSDSERSCSAGAKRRKVEEDGETAERREGFHEGEVKSGRKRESKWAPGEGSDGTSKGLSGNNHGDDSSGNNNSSLGNEGPNNNSSNDNADRSAPAGGNSINEDEALSLNQNPHQSENRKDDTNSRPRLLGESKSSSSASSSRSSKSSESTPASSASSGFADDAAAGSHNTNNTIGDGNDHNSGEGGEAGGLEAGTADSGAGSLSSESRSDASDSTSSETSSILTESSVSSSDGNASVKRSDAVAERRRNALNLLYSKNFCADHRGVAKFFEVLGKEMPWKDGDESILTFNILLELN
jgi:hypothetical protein